MFLVVYAVLVFDIALEDVPRLGGNQIDGPAYRVAAIQRTLRAAQHLDAAHVKQIGPHKIPATQIAAAADICAVAIEPDRRLGSRSAAGAGAADRDLRVGRRAGVEIA